jgi:predicted TIM-barrel fold metal-dependent hydrolase
MRKIDAHMHFGDLHADVAALLAEFDLKLLNICVADSALNQEGRGTSGDGWRGQAELYRQLAQSSPDRYAWCTTFDLPRFDDPTYVGSVLAGLEQDFGDGAIACKVWKNLGMAARDAKGRFVMVDHPLLAPVFDYIAQAGRTLCTHIGSGAHCWQPLDEHNPHREWYAAHPQWYMYGKEGYPTRAELAASRDRLLEQHPTLRMVAAHLACWGDRLDELAVRLDRYPNLAVDISARLAELATQDRDPVRDFFLRYQDRILFGTDVVMRRRISDLPDAERRQVLSGLRTSYTTHFAYLESDGPVTVRGHETRGLGLPPAVLEKVYHTNAERWYPGIG